MVLGAILAIILGSKAHPKIDQKINQILDRFWKDFGLQLGSILAPLAPNIDQKSRSIFEGKRGWMKDSWGRGPEEVGGRGGAPGT